MQSIRNPEQQQKDGDTKDKYYDDKEERRVITGREQKTVAFADNIPNWEHILKFQ